MALAAWAAKVGNDLEALGRQACQEIAYRVVMNTPWDTGWLRGSWQPSFDGSTTKGALDPSGAGANAKISLVAADLVPGQVFYMLNNAAYALRLEYGFVGEDSLGRVYNQPGRFYVTEVVKAWPTIVSDVAADIGLGK